MVNLTSRESSNISNNSFKLVKGNVPVKCISMHDGDSIWNLTLYAFYICRMTSCMAEFLKINAPFLHAAEF